MSDHNPAVAPDVGPIRSGQRSEAAFEAFVHDHHAALVRTVRLIVRDHATAEDIVQETFARAYLKWMDLYPEGNPPGWCHRVATNLAISLKRRAAREAKVLLRLSKRENLTADPPDIVPEVEREVALLPPRQRAAVALYYVLGLPVQECAAAMQCRPGTVKSLLFHARERLRDRIGPIDGSEETGNPR